MGDGWIEFRDVGKRFGERDALLAVDLAIARGSCLALFGHNGSGKTTLLKILATLLRPSAGDVRVAGVDLRKQPARVRRRVGLLLDRPLFPRDFALVEGLRYTADLHGMTGAERRIDALLERVGLALRRRDPLRTFSRGMAQRASLACALLPEPDILLLDEPFTGLDPQGCALVEELAREHRAGGGTSIVVTHDIPRGLRLADRAAIFAQGRIVLEERATDLSTERVEEAIG